MMMKWKAKTLPLMVILLAFLLKGSAAAENARPPFVGKNVQEKMLSIPPKLQEYDYVRAISIVSNTQELPFLLIRAWNEGTIDGMVDLWFVQNEEFTFVDAIRGDARSYAVSSIAYKDDGSVAFFHVGRGGLWSIDGSSKEVKMVTNGLGDIRYFSIINGSLYFTVKSRKELWTSDWTKEGTVMVQDFVDSLQFFTPVTDGFLIQLRNRTMHYWDESDRSTSFLPDIRVEECMPSEVTAIPGDNGSKALIAVNGLWSVGRHPPKHIAENFGWITYIGAMKNEVLLREYHGNGTSSFHATDGDQLRPISMQSDFFNRYSTTTGFFGPFANNTHYGFIADSFFSINDGDANTAELVATLTVPDILAGFLPLLEENKVLVRSVSKLWEFDAAKNELRLLVDWNEKVYLETEPSYARDRTWDTFFVFRDGSLLMPMRKVAERGQNPSYSPLEFWSIQLNANTEEYTAHPVTSAPTKSPTVDGEPNTTPPTGGKLPPGGEPALDESSSSMVPLVVARFGAAFLLVLLGIWM